MYTETMLLLWVFLSLAAFFLLPATGEVVTNFKPCKEFFLDGNPPDLKPMNPARICQRYNNQYRFATMYDKTRIPCTAYRYNPTGGDRQLDWMIEPQVRGVPILKLNIHKLEATLKEQSVSCGIDQKILEKSQAVDRDYRAANRQDRGHLAPSSHQPDQESKVATFTFTNVVPQFMTLNQGQWREYEENINAAGCRETYIIAGAVPGKNTTNNRVNVPSHIWAAGCCVLQEGKRSWAVIAQNDRNNVEHITLGELQGQLVELYKKKNIDLFNKACN
uniref:Endonuclease domain-containing 1 protein-like n=1 Tax=Naja naja TaxID=35670 RepID=A0A8C6X9G4_NAJNA